MILTYFKNLPAYIGYLIGGFFIMVAWLIEKLVSFFAGIDNKTTNDNDKSYAGSEIDT